jgi:hypothetical protein
VKKLEMEKNYVIIFFVKRSANILVGDYDGKDYRKQI